MTYLGTLNTHHYRTRAYATIFTYRSRSGQAHANANHRHYPPATAPTYPNEYASYPLRLNGRPCHFYSGGSVQNSWPFTAAAQPLNNAFGRIVYHPGAITLQWAVSSGAHSISVDVKHSTPTAAKPYITLTAQPDMAIADATDSASADPDTSETLTLSVTATVGGTITVKLINPCFDEGQTVTWGTITTT